MIVECCYNFLKYDFNFYKNIWNWSKFIELFCEDILQHSSNSKTINKNSSQYFYCNEILAMLAQMTDLKRIHFNKNYSNQLIIQNELLAINPIKMDSENECKIENLQKLKLWNFSSNNVVNIEGILLPIFNIDNLNFYKKFNGNNSEEIVMVTSTKSNLRNITLGISSAKAICLSGPVGSGKTSLIEYLARQTGRITKPTNNLNDFKQQQQTENLNKDLKSVKRKVETDNKAENLENTAMLENGFLRIQLGDQTDSKMLLGQYRCTDVPGEFIWQPGVLTQVISLTL